jgi:hypothetical protein
METLAGDQRFEEAADMRDRAVALATALQRQRRMDALRAAALLEVQTAHGTTVRLSHGELSDAEPPAEVLSLWSDGLPTGEAVPRHLADELLCVARFLDEHAGSLRLLRSTGGLASPRIPLADLRPREPERRLKRNL